MAVRHIQNSGTLLDAIAFAAVQHAGQTRVGGKEPYIVHPIRVAHLLERAGMPSYVVVAGVLHDVIEDCPDPRNSPYIQMEWARSFPLVKLVSKFSLAEIRALEMTVEEAKHEYYYGISKELDAVHLKLADRTDNMKDMVRMLLSTERIDTNKGNLRWAQGYLKKSTSEIDPLRKLATNVFLQDEYDDAKAKFITTLGSAE